MTSEFFWLLALSGALAIGALVQLAASWREGDRTLPRGGAGVVLLGARLCLACWSYALVIRGAVSAGLFDHLPPRVAAALGGLAYGAIFASAGGILIAAIGGAAWLIRSIVVGRTS